MINRHLLPTIITVLAIVGTGVLFVRATANTPLEAQGPSGITTTVTVGTQRIPVEVADSFEERSQGLSGRQALDAGTGMLFVFDEVKPVSFWMREMHFDLDIIWIREGVIVGIARDVPRPLPGTSSDQLPTYDSVEPVSHVLEINAGESADFEVGDEVMIATATAS